MRIKAIKCVIIGTLVILSFSLSKTFAQTKVRSTGIGLRGSYWKMSNHSAHIIVTDHGERSAVSVGGIGGWLYFFSRYNNNAFFEFSLGGIATVKEESIDYWKENVDVSTITPLLLGVRYNLFSIQSQSALQPYFTFGGGPYWITDVMVREKLYDDEVTVKTSLKRGGYAGGGFNFMLSSWFAVNFDVKYHFINFNIKHDKSGFDYGLGVSFMWGQYKLRY
ncbi:MAG: porin family protein [candidate division KSB1 bacterium]|nr:porin family protein [candidate division KSB1 bacterium]